MLRFHTHADDSAAVVQDDTVTVEAVSAFAHHLGDTLIEGVTEGNVGDYTALEESPWPDALGAVNDLVGDDEVAGLDLLLQTSDRGESNDGADTNRAKGSNVGAGGDLVGSDLVVRTVAAQESNCDGLAVVLALVVEDGDGGGGSAPRGFDSQRGDLGESRQLTKTGAADHSDWDGRCQIHYRQLFIKVGGVRGR